MTDSVGRKEQIVEAARQLYEDKGVSKTTIKDVADSLGVARSLIYHYFSDKGALTSAVLESYVDDYIAALESWNEERCEGQIEDALDGAVRILRMGVFENTSFRRALDSQESAALFIEFSNTVADHTARYLAETTAEDYARLHDMKIDHLYETFYVLVLGICGYVRTHRDVSDALVKDLIVQTLHMDR